MVEAFHAGVRNERATSVVISNPSPVALEPAPEELPEPEPEPEPFDPALTVAIDLDADAPLFPTEDIELADGVLIGPFEVADEELYPITEDVELSGGLRLGPLAFDPYEQVLASVAATTTPRRRIPVRPLGPRLHSDPGIHSIMTARRMMASGEVIQGSCYKFLSEVYDRAGHRSWRRRRVVYRQGRTGPYADLSLVRPGDWLYIVNDPQPHAGRHPQRDVRALARSSARIRERDLASRLGIAERRS